MFGFDVVGDVREVLSETDPDAASGRYVVRFVSSEYGEGLKKDRFIGPRAADVGVPVPRLVHHGEVALAVGNVSDEERSQHSESAFPLGFSICDRMPGEHMGELQDADRQHLISATVRTIDMISVIDISDTRGYGWFDGDGNGNGKHASWFDYLGAQVFPEGVNDYFDRRCSWFDEGFLEYDVFRRLSDRMMTLASSIPEIDRSVVHMEFGYDNTLVEDDEVSAALDWDNSIIGDHFYDGAWNDLYMPKLDFKQLFADRYELTGRVVPGFDGRWLCFQIHVGLQALQWYGVANKPEAYEWMKAQTLHVVGDGPNVGRHPDSL